MNRPVPVLALLLGCGGPDPAPTTRPTPPDLTEVLGAGQTRAGVITDEAALFAGISAEGRPGDVKIYNSRVAFVVQGVREGSYYIPQGGQIIDADLVREAGQPGRDLVDEWVPMAGLGRLLLARSVEVLDDGRGGEAVVRISGSESPMELVSGVVEADVIPDYGLELVTELRLAPDSWLLEVTTTATATTAEARFTPGDGLLGSADAADIWVPGAGWGDLDGVRYPFTAWVGKRNEGAFGVFLPAGEDADAGGLQALSGVLALAAAFTDEVVVAPGESVSWTRWYGVGPDLATLTSAHLDALGAPTDRVSGVVEAPDGPVAGARVAVSVDGAPWTVAFTGADGSFDVAVPAGSSATTLADGRGEALFFDQPAGAASWSPYAGAPARALVLDSLARGAPPIPLASGRGAGTPDAPLTLSEPGWLEIQAGDALPFEARVQLAGPDVQVDDRLVRARPNGYAAAAWSRDGAVRFPVEPGSYELVVHRGTRFEAWSGPITIAPGATERVEVTLPRAFEHPGYLFGDPHSHGALSPDGGSRWRTGCSPTPAPGCRSTLAPTTTTSPTTAPCSTRSG